MSQNKEMTILPLFPITSRHPRGLPSLSSLGLSGFLLSPLLLPASEHVCLLAYGLGGPGHRAPTQHAPRPRCAHPARWRWRPRPGGLASRPSPTPPAVEEYCPCTRRGLAPPGTRPGPVVVSRQLAGPAPALVLVGPSGDDGARVSAVVTTLTSRRQGNAAVGRSDL